jgi:hypothetical protein
MNRAPTLKTETQRETGNREGCCGHEIILRVTGDGHQDLSHSGIGHLAFGHRPSASGSRGSLIHSVLHSVLNAALHAALFFKYPSQSSGLRFPFETLHLWPTGPLVNRSTSWLLHAALHSVLNAALHSALFFKYPPANYPVSGFPLRGWISGQLVL